MSTPIETFMHTFPRTPVSPAYEAEAARRGFNVHPVVVIEGRKCFVFRSFRCFGGKGRAYHNKVQFQFVDNGEIRTMAAGEFAKKAKVPA